MAETNENGESEEENGRPVPVVGAASTGGIIRRRCQRPDRPRYASAPPHRTPRFPGTTPFSSIRPSWVFTTHRKNWYEMIESVEDYEKAWIEFRDLITSSLFEGMAIPLPYLGDALFYNLNAVIVKQKSRPPRYSRIFHPAGPLRRLCAAVTPSTYEQIFTSKPVGVGPWFATNYHLALSKKHNGVMKEIELSIENICRVVNNAIPEGEFQTNMDTLQAIAETNTTLFEDETIQSPRSEGDENEDVFEQEPPVTESIQSSHSRFNDGNQRSTSTEHSSRTSSKSENGEPGPSTRPARFKSTPLSSSAYFSPSQFRSNQRMLSRKQSPDEPESDGPGTSASPFKRGKRVEGAGPSVSRKPPAAIFTTPRLPRRPQRTPRLLLSGKFGRKRLHCIYVIHELICAEKMAVSVRIDREEFTYRTEPIMLHNNVFPIGFAMTKYYLDQDGFLTKGETLRAIDLPDAGWNPASKVAWPPKPPEPDVMELCSPSASERTTSNTSSGISDFFRTPNATSTPMRSMSLASDPSETDLNLTDE